MAPLTCLFISAPSCVYIITRFINKNTPQYDSSPPVPPHFFGPPVPAVLAVLDDSPRIGPLLLTPPVKRNRSSSASPALQPRPSRVPATSQPHPSRSRSLRPFHILNTRKPRAIFHWRSCRCRRFHQSHRAPQRTHRGVARDALCQRFGHSLWAYGTLHNTLSIRVMPAKLPAPQHPSRPPSRLPSSPRRPHAPSSHR